MYNFDEIIERRGTNALNTDGFRNYIFKNDPTITFPFKDEEFIRMWVADMEFATPQVVIDAIKERLDRRIFGYTKLFDNSYVETFNNWCKQRYDWCFDSEELVLSSGIVPALFDLTARLTSSGEKILITTPSYAYFKYAADKAEREVVCSDLINSGGHYTIDLDDLRKKASDPDVTLFIFCNPHNPTGRVFSPEELKEVASIIEQNNLWVISDEIHCDLLRCGQKHTPLAKVMPDYDKLITCMAPSKTFNLAGMMISNVMIRNKALREQWLADYKNACNPLSLAAAEGAYSNGGEWLDELRVYLDGNFALAKSYFAEHLPEAIFTDSEATYLAWVDLNSYIPREENLPLLFAQKGGVLLEGGDMFVRNSDGFVRLNLACPRSMVEEGLKRIAMVVNSYKK